MQLVNLVTLPIEKKKKKKKGEIRDKRCLEVRILDSFAVLLHYVTVTK